MAKSSRHWFKKHDWLVTGAGWSGKQFFLTGKEIYTGTWIRQQCQLCGKVERQTIADFPLSGEEINLVVEKQYGQRTTFSGAPKG